MPPCQRQQSAVFASRERTCNQEGFQSCGRLQRGLPAQCCEEAGPSASNSDVMSNAAAVYHVMIENQPGRWDFGWEALVAVGTLSLAGFTVWLAWSTRKLAKETAQDVAATFRLVLIDAGDGWAAYSYPGNEGGSGSVAVKNVGPGPALNAHVAVTVRFNGHTETTLSAGLGSVGPRQSGRAQMTNLPRFDAGKPLELDVACSYEDLAGARHRTVFAYRSQAAELTADSPPMLRLPLNNTEVSRLT